MTDNQLISFGRIIANAMDEIAHAASDLPEWAEVEEFSTVITRRDTGEDWTIIVRKGASA